MAHAQDDYDHLRESADAEAQATAEKALLEKSEKVILITQFFKWLHEKTDTFDVFFMSDAIETAKENGLSSAGIPEDEHAELAEMFLATLD